MTTIAYKHPHIATDSREVAGDMIRTDSADKRFLHRNGIFFLSGATPHMDRFMNAWAPEGGGECEHDIEGFAIAGGVVYQTGVHDGKVWTYPVSSDSGLHLACGSGASFALAAMDCGLGAEDAITAAKKRDVFSGGKVCVYSVETGDML